MPAYLHSGTEFGVNTAADRNQTAPAVAHFADGGFVVVWGSFEGGARTIKGQRFDAAGTKVGAEFLVGDFAAGNRIYPAVETLADGRFVVAWAYNDDPWRDNVNTVIKAQLFSSDGTELGDDFRVDTTGFVSYSSPRSPLYLTAASSSLGILGGARTFARSVTTRKASARVRNSASTRKPITRKISMNSSV